MIARVSHRRPDVPRAGREARCADGRARQLLPVPGPLWTILLDGGAERLAGGARMLEDRASAEARAADPAVARFEDDPGLSGVDVRVFDARKRVGATARAPSPRPEAAVG